MRFSFYNEIMRGLLDNGVTQLSFSNMLQPPLGEDALDKLCEDVYAEMEDQAAKLSIKPTQVWWPGMRVMRWPSFDLLRKPVNVKRRFTRSRNKRGIRQ